MTALRLQYNVDKLRQAVRLYGQYSNLAEAGVIMKQAAKLGYAIWKGLRQLMPEKGAVRAERLAALKAGSGIHVRPGVYEMLRDKLGDSFTSKSQRFAGPHNELKGSGFSARRTMNFQALAVQRELSLRESGRGFMAFSTPTRRSFAELAHIEKTSRYEKVLSMFDADVRQDAQKKFASFHWDAGSPALKGLNVAQQMNVLEQAVDATTADIMQYVERKMNEAKNQAGFE